jgi:hypothetical protein
LEFMIAVEVATCPGPWLVVGWLPTGIVCVMIARVFVLNANVCL